MLLFDLYWTSSRQMLSPAFSARSSNRLRAKPSFLASWVRTTGGSWWWSPASSRRGATHTRFRILLAGEKPASSITIRSKALFLKKGLRELAWRIVVMTTLDWRMAWCSQCPVAFLCSLWRDFSSSRSAPFPFVLSRSWLRLKASSFSSSSKAGTGQTRLQENSLTEEQVNLNGLPSRTNPCSWLRGHCLARARVKASQAAWLGAVTRTFCLLATALSTAAARVVVLPKENKYSFLQIFK